RRLWSNNAFTRPFVRIALSAAHDRRGATSGGRVSQVTAETDRRDIPRTTHSSDASRGRSFTMWWGAVVLIVGCQHSVPSGEPPFESTVAAPVLEPVPLFDGELPSEPGDNDGPLPSQLRITELARYGSQDTARIVVFLNRPASYEVGKLAASGGKGPRLFLDIAQATYAGASQYDVGGVVERIRLGHQAGAVRVVLDLRERVSERVFFLPEPFRLIIDVASAREGVRPASAKLGKEITRVVLDAGHGGHDPGAIGASGLMEKDVARDVALRAAPLSARERGVSALITRE